MIYSIAGLNRNASATEALPIFLSGLVDEVVAIILSVTAVLLFGEIIPASILTGWVFGIFFIAILQYGNFVMLYILGPNQLKIAASLTPLVYFVMFIFFPVAYPLSQVLDYFIGHDVGITVYNRKVNRCVLVHAMKKFVGVKINNYRKSKR